MDKIKVLNKEPRDLHRKVLETVHIKLMRATLKHNGGYLLPELYLSLLRDDTWGRAYHWRLHCLCIDLP